MPVVVESDPARFAERVMPFLEEDVARNLPATVLLGILDGRGAGSAPVLAYLLGQDGQVAAVAMRTPPRPMICTNLSDDQAEELIDPWLEADPVLAGVNAPAPAARALVGAWERRTDGVAERRAALALHSLTRVIDPPRPAAGELRPAAGPDVALLVDWTLRFALEAGARSGDPTETIRARIALESLWLWHAPDGEPVCMVGAEPPVAGVPRIAPVYTPPSHRRRGYASSAVAEASRRLLGRGARACALFTDLANPTANKIYAQIGYRRIGDWEDYRLDSS